MNALLYGFNVVHIQAIAELDVRRFDEHRVDDKATRETNLGDSCSNLHYAIVSRHIGHDWDSKDACTHLVERNTLFLLKRDKTIRNALGRVEIRRKDLLVYENKKEMSDWC